MTAVEIKDLNRRINSRLKEFRKFEKEMKAAIKAGNPYTAFIKAVSATVWIEAVRDTLKSESEAERRAKG